MTDQKLDALLKVMTDQKAETKHQFELRDKSSEAMMKQIGQLASDVAKLQTSAGQLPSDTTVNPNHYCSSSKKGNNVHINAVSLLPNFEISSVEVNSPPQCVEGVVEDVSDESDCVGQNETMFQNGSKLKSNEKSFCENCSCDKCFNEKLTSTRDEGVENNTTSSKIQDPGVPLLSIQIGEFKTDRTLLDLGACVSIMPSSLYDQYEFVLGVLP